MRSTVLCHHIYVNALMSMERCEQLIYQKLINLLIVNNQKFIGRLTQKVVRPGQLLNQYDTACLNCYHSDLGNVDRADKCDKTWEAVVRRKTGRSVTEEPETIITGTSEARA